MAVFGTPTIKDLMVRCHIGARRIYGTGTALLCFRLWRKYTGGSLPSVSVNSSDRRKALENSESIDVARSIAHIHTPAAVKPDLLSPRRSASAKGTALTRETPHASVWHSCRADCPQTGDWLPVAHCPDPTTRLRS